LAIIATTLKPVLRLTDKVRHKQELLTSYQTLDHDLHCIGIETRHRQAYDDDMHKELMKALKRKAELVKKGDSPSVSRKTQEKYQEEVKQEPLSITFIFQNNYAKSSTKTIPTAHTTTTSPEASSRAC